MLMNFIYFVSIISILILNFVSCSSDNNLESIKIGISKFNEIGNGFFNLIRLRLNPDKVDINDFTNFRLSFEQFTKGSGYYLSYYILVGIGVAFAIFLPFTGLIFLCCRCRGKCGGKKKAMDPHHVKCKRVVYAVLLVLFCTATLICIVFALLNNYVIHEIVVNEDKSVNIFLGLKLDFNNINQALSEMKESIYKSQSVKMDSNKSQEFSKDLADNIQKFYLKLVEVSELQNIIESAKFFKKVLNRDNVSQSQTFILKVNDLLIHQRNNLTILKERIKRHLAFCLTPECTFIKNKTEELRIYPIHQDIIVKINQTLDLLKSETFEEGLAKIIGLKNNSADMNIVAEKQLKYIKDKISSSSFSDSVKKVLVAVIDNIISMEQVIQQNIPSPDSQNTSQHEFYKNSMTFESYRFYGYIGICCVIFVIILCYYFGILFGNCGERATEDAGWCNRGVGSKFLISGVYLTFFFFSFFVVVVIANMLTSGVINTDICRYTSLENENNAKVLDLYLKIASKAADKDSIPQGIMDALINKCANQNFYKSFYQINEQLILKNLKDNFANFDEKIVNLVLGEVNFTILTDDNIFKSSSSIDFQQIVNLIGLLNTDSDVSNYISELNRIAETRSDAEDIFAINNNVIELRTSFRLIIQLLNNSENDFNRLKAVWKLFNNDKEAIIRSKSSLLQSSIQIILFKLIHSTMNEMFQDVDCKNLRLGVVGLFKTICKDVIDPLNGVWYGIGFYLLLSIPCLVFATLLSSFYRRIQKFYPDKEEPDYDNYIGFYARADSEAFKNNNEAKKPAHRGYKPIPLQQVS